MAMKILAIGDFQGKFPKKLQKQLKKESFDAVIGVGDYTGLDEWRPFIMAQLSAAKQGGPAPEAEEFFGRKRYKILRDKDYEFGRKILDKINSFNKPTFVVFGNTDWYNYPFQRDFVDTFHQKKSYDKYVKKLRNIHNINYKKSRFQEMDLVGFGGYMDIESYFDKREWKQSENRRKIERRLRRHDKAREKLFYLMKKTKSPSVLVLHYPPFGVFDIIKGGKDNPMNGKSAGVKFFSEVIKKSKPLFVLCGHMHEYHGMKKLHGVPVINPGDAGNGKCAIVTLEDRRVSVKFIK